MKKIFTLTFFVLFTSFCFTQEKYSPAKISKQKVLENYLITVTHSRNFKQAEKKILKIKTLIKASTLKVGKSPMEITDSSFFKFPNKHYSFKNYKGFLIEKKLFDGKNGFEIKMQKNQTMKIDTLSPQSVADFRKVSAVYLEYSLLCNLDSVTLLGAIQKEGQTKMYVIKYAIGKLITIAYYNAKTGLKEKATVTEKINDKSLNYTTVFSTYRDFDKYLFPTKISQIVGGATVKTTVNAILVNKEIADDTFSVIRK